MLRSALTAVRSAALHPDYCKQLNIVLLSRLFGTNFRFYTAQSTPDAANSSKDDASTEQKTIEPEKKAQETKESEHDRLLKEKNALLQDLQFTDPSEFLENYSLMMMPHKAESQYQDKYKRSLADNENILTRTRKQIDEAKLFGIQSFSKDLLEVADILGKATGTVPKEEMEGNVTLKNLYEGLLMTETQLQKVFKKNGLEKINPVDEKFDPYSHEALFQIPSPDKEAGTVAVVEKVGYKLHGRTLRPALVGVVKE